MSAIDRWLVQGVHSVWNSWEKLQPPPTPNRIRGRKNEWKTLTFGVARFVFLIIIPRQAATQVVSLLNKTTWTLALELFFFFFSEASSLFYCRSVWLYLVPPETLETTSIEHLPLSVCLTYFPSFCAPSLPPCCSVCRGQVIPLTLAETDVVHLWSGYLAPSRWQIELAANQPASCKSYGAVTDHWLGFSYMSIKLGVIGDKLGWQSLMMLPLVAAASLSMWGMFLCQRRGMRERTAVCIYISLYQW